MQNRLTELLAAQTINAGVYLRAPVSPEQLLIDLHVLGNWLVRTPHLIELIKLFGGRPTDHEIGVWGRRLSLPPVPGQPGDNDAVIARPERIALNAPAAWVGAGVTAALSVLMQPSLDEAGQALRAAMPSITTRELRYHRRKSGIVHSPAVTGVQLKARAADFTVLQHLRFRTITELPRLPDTARHARMNAMLHVVPTLFWPEWAFRLGIERLAWGTARQVMSRLLLTIGSTMAEHRMRRHLRSTVRIERVARIANDLRGLPHWSSITTALLRLHEHLQANPPPIDYQRRRTLNYAKLLPEAHWTRLVADEGFRSAPTTATAARLWLTEQLSGAPIATTPPLLCPGVCTDRMRGTLTPNLIKNLDAISVEYLRSQGVSEEPTTWVPPLSLLDGLSLPGVPAEMIKPKKIHDLLATGLTIPAVARRLEVSVWKVRYQIEHHPMPATMAASRQPKKIKGRIELKAGERIWSQT